MIQKETPVIKRIQLALGSGPDTRLFRNETGLFWAGTNPEYLSGRRVILHNWSRVSAGLTKKGSSDLIGIEGDGRFIAIEVKLPGTATPEGQEHFIQMVLDRNGIAGFVKDVAEAKALLGRG